MFGILCIGLALYYYMQPPPDTKAADNTTPYVKYAEYAGLAVGVISIAFAAYGMSKPQPPKAMLQNDGIGNQE
jgi:uncharacterized membrane protein YfcA